MDQQFLEQYPLFKKLKIQVPTTLGELQKVSIHMKCLHCNSDQTFNMANNYYENSAVNAFIKTGNQRLKLIYHCQFCKNFERTFYIFISPSLDYVYKIGQYPEWEISMDKNLENLFGVKSKTFKKGLVCESQGYGIGAFAYYRRITEEIIDELLEKISNLIGENDKEKYLKALEQTKKTRVTQEKIDLVKDLLPEILRPNGLNPLGVLHRELSEGLHNETDERCLEIAGHIREILTFLINQVIQSQNAANAFTSSMKAILDKKNKTN